MHAVVRQRLNEEIRDERTKDRQPRSNPERPRIAPRGILASLRERRDHRGERPRPDKRANLAYRRGRPVELTAHSGRAGFRGEEPEAVAGAHLTEGEEDAVDDGEGGDVVL